MISISLEIVIIKAYHIFACLIIAATLTRPFTTHATDDMDWHWGVEPIHGQGMDKPADGKLWGIAAVKDDIQITFRLEAKNDMSMGRWIGDIRAPEKFYVKFRLMNHDGHQIYYKIEGARALGPDAQSGIWKDGPAIAPQQVMIFDFNWEKALKLKHQKSLIISYSSFDNKNESTDIVIPLDNYATKLSEMEAAIRAVPGSRKFLLTDADIRSMPINQLPAEIGAPLIKELDQASEFLGRDKADLMTLSFSSVENLITDQRKAKSKAAQEAKKAEHQKIYDQEPDWRDLNVCPKPDVNECRNIGRLGYEIDDLFNMEHDYGKTIGVVWRSEGSIIHIYGGSVNLDIDPKIVRAKSGKYYYVLESDEGYLEIRPVKTMLFR